VAASALTRAELLDLYQVFGLRHDVTLRLSSGLFELLTTGMRIKQLGSLALLSANRTRLSFGERILKRLTDLALATLALIVLSPLMLAIGLWIKLDSPGPVIHRRRVLGTGGKVFDAFKFRTMVLNGDEVLARHPDLARQLARDMKIKDDPRVTRIGKQLRRLSLDELPQLLNVLRGQMSLVGPRMITPEEAERYGHWQLNLLTVKPGITGLWQVSGRSDVSYQERVQIDMNYIRNYSLWLDLALLARTIPAVFKKTGAY
jgi:exopolysaccharide biosynthesis polyprenyl glycosylphosphotransferase